MSWLNFFVYLCANWYFVLCRDKNAPNLIQIPEVDEYDHRVGMLQLQRRVGEIEKKYNVSDWDSVYLKVAHECKKAIDIETKLDRYKHGNSLALTENKALKERLGEKCTVSRFISVKIRVT